MNQMLPTSEQEILGETENVLEETFASPLLPTNLLIGWVYQVQHRVE